MDAAQIHITNHVFYVISRIFGNGMVMTQKQLSKHQQQFWDILKHPYPDKKSCQSCKYLSDPWTCLNINRLCRYYDKWEWKFDQSECLK